MRLSEFCINALPSLGTHDTGQLGAGTRASSVDPNRTCAEKIPRPSLSIPPCLVRGASAPLGAMAATRTIELKTAVPGPRSREVLARLEASVAAPLAVTFPVVAAEARGARI